MISLLAIAPSMMPCYQGLCFAPKRVQVFNVFQSERPQVLPLIPLWGSKAIIHIILSSAVMHPDHECREGRKGWLNQLPLSPTSGLVSGKWHGRWFWGTGNVLFLNLGADSIFMFILWNIFAHFIIYVILHQKNLHENSNASELPGTFTGKHTYNAAGGTCEK